MVGPENTWQNIGTLPGGPLGGDEVFAMCNINMAFMGVAVFICLFISDDFRSGYAKNLFTVRARKGDYVISKTLAGFVCGPWYALAVGGIAPIMRYALFGMPPPMPTGLAMTFELAVYGLIAGLLYRKLPKTVPNIYISLICAMLAGRIVWGIATLLIMGVTGGSFGWTAFLTGAVTGAIPGIIVQLVLIPVLVYALRKAGVIE